MKYKEITSEEAREYCRKHSYKNTKGLVISKCEECELRRTRTDEKGKEHILFCFHRLQDLLSELVDDYEEVRNEEIKYYKPL